MAYRRLIWMSKGLIPALAFTSLTAIGRNLNDNISFSAPTGSLFFLPYQSTVSKDQFYSLNLLSVVNNVSESQQEKDEFLEKAEPQIRAETIENIDGDNVNDVEKGNSKSVLDMTIDVRRQLSEIIEKIKEIESFLGEMIDDLKGFVTFVTWNAEEETLIRLEKTIRLAKLSNDLKDMNSKCMGDLERFHQQIKGKNFIGGGERKPLRELMKAIFFDIVRMMVVKSRVNWKAKKLQRMLRRRERMKFCFSVIVRER